MILSIPISILLGAFCGSMLNRARGREMITSYIISFFINGVYQLVVLYMMGSIIPIQHSEIKLPRGYGIRNTVSLLNMRQCIDNLLAINVNGVKIPVLTFILIALLCLFIIWFRKTKLGQDMRAVGQDMEVARDAGIKVERTRIISIVMSTVFAGFGMILYLQNMGNLSTYSSHSQIGMFCIAALLVGMTCCAAKAVFGSCAEVGVQQTVRNLEDFFLWLRDVWTLAREKLELCAVIR